MDMQSGLYRRSLVELVRSGEIPESVVDEAVRRVLRVKFALDLVRRSVRAGGGICCAGDA